MATNKSVKNQLQNKKPANNDVGSYSLKGLLNSPSIKKKFEDMLNDRASSYMTSIVNLVSGDTNLMKCEPMSIISSCVVAATLDLPVDKNLGYAWVVPYGNKATFQLGYKGYVQLALRTGQYRTINALPIYEGQLEHWNPLTEELKLDFEGRKSDKVVGYTAHFELINGFRKTVYWSKDAIDEHKKKFSKSNFGWKDNYDAMALKTVLRNMLSKWGILSVDMQTAFQDDEKAPAEDEESEQPEVEVFDMPDEPVSQPEKETKTELNDEDFPF
ncbi:recombinase RecT [Bacillaceae bacterium SIJ1]|uniref:recombinase RecT n=1 Tax=Litoribacterium kuwaitense TaxID=1398745 RepID=UPI0013EDBA3B|nr:recombinase RecT [Litoribacterium kuwaitense]NGP46009.1 recombinase RecT [Litoribacterium kuwaitense]